MKFTHYTRTCQMCGAEMQGVGSRKLYCPDCLDPVSYTHLTLPTNSRV